MPGVTNFDSIKLLTALTATELGSNAVTTAKIINAAVTTAKLAAALQAMPRSHTMPTIATTGVEEVIFVAPYTGVLSAAAFAGKDALAANDTNYITVTVINKTNSNTAMLAVSDLNTTKLTGGVAIGAYTRRTLTLHGTPANLNVTLGDIIAFVVTATGTLANTITEPVAVLTFTPS